MKIRFIIYTAAVLLTSCEKNVTLNIPAQEKKLVIHGLVRNTTPFRVTVGQSVGILDLTTAEGYKVTNALVQLFENNVVRDTLIYDSASAVYAAKRNTSPQPGRSYKIQASSNGFAVATAESKAPFGTVVRSVTRTMNVKKDADGNFVDEIKIVFQDDPAATNSYLFRFRRPVYVNNNNMVYNGVYCMKSADVDIERRNNSDPVEVDNCINSQFFMTDVNFNGKEKELLLFITHSELDSMFNPLNNRLYRPYFELQSITPDHYKYLKSSNTYRDADGNPFAEPVLVYSNVNNGYGIFAAYDLARDTIR